jgi:hypothetical protein
VGVYAGREGVTKEEMDMTLGRVWHRRLLDEIFYDQIPGNESKSHKARRGNPGIAP